MDRLKDDKFIVKYILEDSDTCLVENGKEYTVVSVERGLYRINTELDETYLFDPRAFEVVSGERPKDLYAGY